MNGCQSLNQESTTANNASLLDCLYPIVRWRWLFFGLAFAAVAAGIGVSFVLPPVYTATAYFMPRGALGESDELAGLVGETGKNWEKVQSSADIVKYYTLYLKGRLLMERMLQREFATQGGQRSLRTILAHELGDPDLPLAKIIEALRKQINVTSGGGKVVAVSCMSRDPKLSADLTNALIEEFERLPRQTQRTSATLELVEQRITAVQDRLSRVEAEIATLQSRVLDAQEPDTVIQIAAKRREAQNLSDLLTQLNTERAKAEIRSIQAQSESMQDIDLVESAFPPLRKSNMSKAVIALLSLLAGLLAAAIVAYGTEYVSHARREQAGHPLWGDWRAARRDFGVMAVLGLAVIAAAAAYYFAR